MSRKNHKMINGKLLQTDKRFLLHAKYLFNDNAVADEVKS